VLVKLKNVMSINCSAVNHGMVLQTCSQDFGTLNVVYKTESLQRSIPHPTEVNYA